MNTLPDSELNLDKLFLPAWAQEPSASKYAKYEGETERPDRRGDRDRRGPRPPRRDGPPGPRRDGNRPQGDRRGPPRPEGGAPRPEGDRGRPFGGPRPDFRLDDLRERRPPPPPLPEIDLSLRPEDKGVESLARQIKMTGRAYPLFDIAQMILQKPERHTVIFSSKRKNAEGKPVQPMFVCALDDTLWLSEDEAIAYALKKYFATFYQAERTATEPPKGKYTFVAQCSLSGVILGPPNHHDYQNLLRKLHSERFSRMPFEEYKSRVRIVRDEEVVKKWVDDQSWKTDYVCLNLPEPLRLENMEAVEKHFRETHKESIVKLVDSHTLTGAAARLLRSPDLARLVRSVWEDQRRFPLQIATVLSQQFAGHGLQFFKVNKTLTHVCVARPHYLDMNATPVSEGVKQIVEYINANPKCTRRHLVEALAPSPVSPAGGAVGGDSPAEPQPDSSQPTPEQTAVIADLHWLIHQGHVIEFANGILETAKKPLPKPEPKRAPAPAEAVPAAASVPVDEAAGPQSSMAPVASPAEESPQPESATPTGGAPADEPPVALPEVPVSESPVATPSEPPVEASVAPVESPS
ncbi:MAG: hypothetical protein NT154_10920 [Verrucomicrobia bacterium]|nr:hypothetical protein [Verrucomicrobiota bacterium]